MPSTDPFGRPIQPGARLLFWIRAAFVGDAAIAAFGAILLAVGSERAAFAVFAFVVVRAAIGTAALVLALRTLHPDPPPPE